MATNRAFDAGRNLSVTATHPALPLSGQPLRVGLLTGVALCNERAAGDVTADFGPAVYNLPVRGIDDQGASAVIPGDKLYYVDADVNDGTGYLSKKSSGYFFGFALGSVNVSTTTTIAVAISFAANSATLGDATLIGTQMAAVANANVIGGIPVIHRISIADGAADTDVLLTHKTRVLDVWVQKITSTGGASDAITVKNVTNAITDVMSLNSVAAGILVRCLSIAAAYHEITAGTVLRVTAGHTTNNACTVYVLGIRV